MNRAEFDQWWDYHSDAFGNLAEWFAKRPEKGRRTMAQWGRTLSRVSLDDAKAATDAMHAGDLEEPRGFDRHPAAIRRAAVKMRTARARERDRRRSFVDGEEVFRCPQCQDDGRLIVWHYVAMAAADPRTSETFGDRGTVASMLVACDCDAGGDHDYIPKYDPAKFLIGDWGNPESEAELLRWMAQKAGQ